jgi:hypothetical protein
MKAVSTWTQVSSGDTTVESQYRDTTSTTAITHHPRSPVKWVKS